MMFCVQINSTVCPTIKKIKNERFAANNVHYYHMLCYRGVYHYFKYFVMHECFIVTMRMILSCFYSSVDYY